MKKYFILAAVLTLSTGLIAQKTAPENKPGLADSLLNSMSADSSKERVIAFRSTRLILSQTTETVRKKTMNFLVIHRFGDFAGDKGGARPFYGLDDVADVYIGFEYGLSDNLNIDFGRTTIGGMVTLALKYAVLHQTTDGGTPIALTLFGETGVRPYGSFSAFGDRLSYFGQVIISRQFGSSFSFQVSPGLVQNNTPLPLTAGSEQSFFSLSGAARLKVSRHMSLVVDYAHPFSSFRQNGANGFSDPLGFGIEVETGGHVFTVNISNAQAITDINYLSNTKQSFGRGEYRIGFTISRIFDFNRKSTYK